MSKNTWEEDTNEITKIVIQSVLGHNHQIFKSLSNNVILDLI